MSLLRVRDEVPSRGSGCAPLTRQTQNRTVKTARSLVMTPRQKRYVVSIVKDDRQMRDNTTVLGGVLQY